MMNSWRKPLVIPQMEPATATGTLVMVRFQPDQLAELDAFIAMQPERISRPEAIRLLVRRGSMGEAHGNPSTPGAFLGATSPKRPGPR
jgi:hypothetical protein